MKIKLYSLLLASLSIVTVHAAEVGDISAPETIALERRVQTRNFTILGFGPGNLSGLGDDGFAYHLQGGWWREAHPNAAIRILSDLDFRPDFDAWKLSGGVGAVWLVSRQSVSPFLGADFGWGFANGVESANGFTLGGSVGVQLFRTATTQMSIEGRTSVIMDGDQTPWSNSVALSVDF
ncbi:MAG: hypothetical protein IPK50_13415 [Fibrobacterota bacterium]|nr:hypothetical protein [Fibrobacterota bacterium]QQS03306.1 MAG: hypothetical protein IPK50_13415 [Fibrobacterota bacterium]